MKKVIKVLTSLIISLLLAFSLFASNEKTIVSEITDVTVFLKGAQINRSSDIFLNKGVNQLIFSNLSTEINQQSIQVGGEGNFTILSVNHQLNYLHSVSKNANIRLLEDSLKLINTKIGIRNYELEVFRQEQDMLEKNKSITGDNGLKAIDLKTSLDFFRKRLLEIKTKEFELINIMNDLNISRQRLENQLGEASRKQNKPTGEIVVKVLAEIQLKGKMTLKYTVMSAGWSPNYDIKVEDITQPVNLAYKARVFQKTGENWNDVNITLSTGNPTESGTKPTLVPWYLTFWDQMYSIELSQYNSFGPRNQKREETASDKYSAFFEDEAGSIADYTSINHAQTNTEFNIAIPYSIPTDGKNYLVEIQKHKLNADFEYFALPKLDRDAFLVAHITGWEAFNLLSGEMNLFFEGTYVGKSFLDVRNTNDTLDLSLGRDKSIVITRVKLKEYSSKKFIGGTKKESRAWQIAVRNKKNRNINIRIEDQLPVSSHEDIDIEVIETSKAKYKEETGILRWDYELKPGEEKNIIVKYEVKYPKDRNVVLD